MEAMRPSMILANEVEFLRPVPEVAGEIRSISVVDIGIPAFAREHLGRELRGLYDAVLASGPITVARTARV